MNKIVYETNDIVVTVINEGMGPRLMVKAKGGKENAELEILTGPSWKDEDRSLWLKTGHGVFISRNMGAWPAMQVVASTSLTNNPG